MFAAIYHPVGLAMVTQKWKNTGMRLAVNGVWGNLGVASAALITGYLIDHGGWRMAFIIPGVVLGRGRRRSTGSRGATEIAAERRGIEVARPAAASRTAIDSKALLLRVSLIVFMTTAVSSIIFQATTFALPKIFDERLQGIASTAAAWLQRLGLRRQGRRRHHGRRLAFAVFAIASLAQLVVGSLLDRLRRAPGVHGRGRDAARVLRPDGRPRARAGRWRSRSASCSARSGRSRSTTS